MTEKNPRRGTSRIIERAIYRPERDERYLNPNKIAGKERRRNKKGPSLRGPALKCPNNIWAKWTLLILLLCHKGTMELLHFCASEGVGAVGTTDEDLTVVEKFGSL